MSNRSEKLVAVNKMKQIPSYPKYLINKSGQIYNQQSGCWRKPVPNAGGYLTINLTDQTGTGRTLRIHRLVLETFVGKCPEGKEARHLNGIRADNRLSNLCWGTRKENINDSMKHGTFFALGRFGEKHLRSILSDYSRRIIIYCYQTGLFTLQELATEYNVSSNKVHQLTTGKSFPFYRKCRI